MVKTMREMGLFGITIDEKYGGLGLDIMTYVLVVQELSRGWISLTGVMNTHFMAAWMLENFGTEAQKAELLPLMATGELRSAYSMTEPNAGSDVQAIKTRARRDGNDWVIDGQKMWSTNGLRSGMIMLLTVTDPTAQPRHKGMTAFIIRKKAGVTHQPGLTHSRPAQEARLHRASKPPNWFLRVSEPRPTRFSAVRRVSARGSNTSWRRWSLVASMSPRARWASPPARSRRRSVTRSSGRLLENLSASIKQSSSRSVTWAPRSALPNSWCTTRRGVNPRAIAQTWKPEWPSCLPPRSRKPRCWRRCAFMADTAIRQGEYIVFQGTSAYRDAPLLILGEGTNEIQQLLIARRLLEQHAILRNACRTLGCRSSILLNR